MRGGADETIPQGTFSQVLTRESPEWDKTCTMCASCECTFSENTSQKITNLLASSISRFTNYKSHKKHHCRGCGRCYCDNCCRKITSNSIYGNTETELFCYTCVEMQPEEKRALGISDAE